MTDTQCYRFFVVVDGERVNLTRSVTHDHPESVHAALGTHSEIELQDFLDRVYYADWFDVDGHYLGEDCDGLGVAITQETAT